MRKSVVLVAVTNREASAFKGAQGAPGYAVTSA